jgi:hypothetical protein
VKNARFTYGLFGQERPDSKFLPGDVVFLMFDIDGLKLDKNGRASYSVSTELTYKAKGKAKPIVKRGPEPLEAILHLGGTRLPSWHRSVINPDSQPGTYTIQITITDRNAGKKEAVLTRSFEVVPKTFGFVRVGLSSASGDPTPPVAVPGQLIGINFALTGFALKKGQPDVTIEMRVLDSAGRPTLRRPYTGELKSVGPAAMDIVPFDPIPLPLNQAGRFKIELKATDNVAKKSVERVLDLNVIDLKK